MFSVVVAICSLSLSISVSLLRSAAIQVCGEKIYFDFFILGGGGL
jgi:hypothetical protein